MIAFALSMPFSFDEPAWLWLCALVPVLVLASLRSMAGLAPVRRASALFVRSLLVIMVAVCLAGIEHVEQNKNLTVLFLMDRSHSVEDLEDAQDDLIRKVTENPPSDDRVGVIDFARSAYLEQLPMRGGYLIPDGRLPQMSGTDRTNIAGALRLAMAMFPHDSAKRVVLLTDGNDNMGDVLTEAQRAAADGISIDVVPLWYRHKNEIHIERMIAPPYAQEGEQVPIRLVIASEKPASGTIAVFHNGQRVEIPNEFSHVDLRSGRNTFYTKITANNTGAQRYEAIFRPDRDEDDAVSLNNVASAFSFVTGSSRALLISNDALHDQPLVDALRSENVKVDLMPVEELEDFDLLGMMGYSTIILANIEAGSFTDQQHIDLARYVKDMGSGLIMLGGDRSFGAGGWIGTPVEDVMPVSFEIKHKRVIPRGALVIIMHSCEIPRGNFWGKAMAKKSVDTISSQDYLGVLAYSFSPPGESWEVPLRLNTNKSAVKAKIDQMQIGDMPDFQRTMQMAYKELVQGRGKDAAQKHVIIMSDGDATAPSAKLLKDYKAAKITVSTIALGWGGHVMQRTMKDVANKTGGKYYDAKRPRELPQIFVKESKVVRRPLIIDEGFQPQFGTAYSEILSGLSGEDVLPPLGGMVLTSPRPNPNAMVPIVRMTADGADPVLAHWQCELGKTVAFTSGYWPRWGKDWVSWSKYAKTWAQIVRWSMRQETPANFDTHIKVEGNKARIVVDALDKDAKYLNFLQFKSRLVGPGREAFPVELMQTGPGHYEAEVDADMAGQYLANLHIFESGQHRGTIRTGFTVPFSPEYRVLRTNEALLRRVVELTSGRWIDPTSDDELPDVFSHDLPPTKASQPIWDWVVAWLLLPLFLMDVSVRRLANWLALSIVAEVLLIVVLLWGFGMRETPAGIIGAVVIGELVGWIIRYQYIRPLFEFVTQGAFALRHTGERSTASLGQLKDTRERVRDEMEQPASEKLQRIRQDIGNVAPRDSGAKYDIGDDADRPSGDLHDALGGAKTSSDYKERRRAPAPDEASDGEDATSRLLRAKRRARRDMNKDDDK